MSAASPDDLLREGKYVEAIESLEQAWRTKGGLAPEELKTYLEAYYLHGKELLAKDDLKNARACFLRVIGLDRRHGDSHFQLGALEKKAKNFQKALPYLRAAISLGSQHSPEANTAIIEIGSELLTAAEKAINEGQVETARAYLNFVSSNFPGEEKNKAMELATYKLTPLTLAGGEYSRATQLLNARNKPEAVRILRGIPRTYPDTFFARKANELLEQLGERIVLVRTSSGLELPPNWKRKETAHFEVYYEKEIFFSRIVPRAEQVLRQIFTSLDYPNSEWKKKLRIYLFSSQSDWQKFLQANKAESLEWMDAFLIPHAMELYLYETGDTSSMVERTLPHELTHVVHYSLVGDLSHTPRWFGEGLATRHEKGRPSEALREVRTLRRSDSYIPFSELVSLEDYPPDRGKIYMLYLESVVLVDLLLQKFGPAKIKEIALAYKQPVTFDKLAKDVLATTMGDLEKLWKRAVE